jgi:hypothetical protein
VKKVKPLHLALGAIGLAIGWFGVLALREATLSTHQRAPGRGVEVVLFAETKGGEPRQTLSEMVEAQLLTCRLEITSDLQGQVESLGEGRYRAMLAPALDETNKRQFRGCVEDWVIDHVRIDVLELTTVPCPRRSVSAAADGTSNASASCP